MNDIDMTKLPDPASPEIQEAVIGNAARVAVAVHWALIEHLLKSDIPVAAIYRRLRKAGHVRVTRQAFTRQVKVRREGSRGSNAAAKPEAEPRPSAESAEASEEAKPDTPAAAAAKPELQEIKPGIPHRPWRTGPRTPPDPNAVFKPRDPLADD